METSREGDTAMSKADDDGSGLVSRFSQRLDGGPGQVSDKVPAPPTSKNG
ncbi:hypothetical protein ACEQUB_p00720 (plasmid) [Ralstonia syzygii]